MSGKQVRHLVRYNISFSPRPRARKAFHRGLELEITGGHQSFSKNSVEAELENNLSNLQSALSETDP